MKPTENDDLLWEMGRKVSGNTVSGPATEELDAYRSGRLSRPRAADVERALSHAPNARRRLAERTELGAAWPNPRVREAVLAGFGAPAEEDAGASEAKPRRPAPLAGGQLRGVSGLRSLSPALVHDH